MGHEHRVSLFVDIKRNCLILTYPTDCHDLQSRCGSGDCDEVISLPGKRVVNEQWPNVSRCQRLRNIVARRLAQQLHSLIEKKIRLLLCMLHIANVLSILLLEFAKIVELRPACITFSAMLIISKHHNVEPRSITGGKRNSAGCSDGTPESFGCRRMIMHVTRERTDLRRLGLRLGPQS